MLEFAFTIINLFIYIIYVVLFLNNFFKDIK